MGEGHVKNASLLAVLCLASAASWNYLLRTSEIDPAPINLVPSPPMNDGIYAPNGRLEKAEKIGLGLVHGPEDIALDREKKSFFTGCEDGWIKRVWIDGSGGEGRVENWTFVGGRPLGVVVGPNQEVIVCELFKGLLNVTKDNVEVLCNEADGLKFKMVDGVDVTKEGVIYFTEATYKHSPAKFELAIFEYRPHGRLIKYDPTTKTATVLLKDLYFSNGVALSAQEDFLVFCETVVFRCRKYWLKGEKSGKVETFIENLPGVPDNIIIDEEGSFWIGLLGRKTLIWEMIIKYPTLRHVLVRMWSIINPHVLFKRGAILNVNGNGEAIAFFDSNRPLISGGVKV
ncbi:hypothetical protein KI387_033055, partial [Taxus chinensis]